VFCLHSSVLSALDPEFVLAAVEDLNLQEVQSLQGCNFIAVSKHLCGPATDLSLRCCIHGADSGLRNGTPNNEGCREGPGNPMLDGLGIATCCHHLCQWSSYISKSLREALTTLDFIFSGSRLEITLVSKLVVVLFGTIFSYFVTVIVDQ
jgi:hypothetical protein